MSYQFDVLTAQKFTCLTRCVRARIVMMENDSSLAVGFTNFSDDFRQTNGRVPLRIDRPTLLKRNSGHMTHSAEETGDHLLRCASSTNNFCWIQLVLEYPHGRLLFFFGSYVYFHDSSPVTILYTSFEAPRSNFLIISLHQSTRAFF